MLTTIMSYYPITWDTSSALRMTINSDNSITSNATDNFNARIQSTTQIDNTQDAKFVLQSSSAGDNMLHFGLGKDPFPGGATTEYDSIEYGCYLNGSTWSVKDGSSYQSVSTTGSYTDTVEFKRETGNIIKLYINSSLEHTYSNPSSDSDDLYIHVTGKGSSSVLVETTVESASSSSDSVNAHAHLKPLQVFRRQRDWF